MRYAILGDIHANIQALSVCLNEIDRLDVDQILCVGDVVGYGPSPREVIARLDEYEVVSVKGNHDAAVAGELDLTNFNPAARAAAQWTRRELTRSERDWLEQLPLRLQLEHCLVAHGAPSDAHRYPYVMNTEDADPYLDAMTGQICFIGHTHVPLTLLRHADNPYRTSFTESSVVEMQDVWRALVNVGSVGQPRDEDPRTGFGIFETEEQTYALHRLPYDTDREAARVREAGLPDVLASRLLVGI